MSELKLLTSIHEIEDFRKQNCKADIIQAVPDMTATQSNKEIDPLLQVGLLF